MKQAKNDNNSTYSKTHKKLFITEKPSVARDFAKALRIHMREKISMEVKVPVKRDPEQRMPLRLKL